MAYLVFKIRWKEMDVDVFSLSLMVGPIFSIVYTGKKMDIEVFIFQ